MPHVDEGTLHAYLDGELSPVERGRVDTHLKGCPACQAHLAEERAIIERATRLLGIATPLERAIPPLHQLRQPRLTWRLRRPLAWAATMLFAVGLGWYARGTLQRSAAPQREAELDKVVTSAPAAAAPALASVPAVESATIATAPRSSLATPRGARLVDSISKDRDVQRQLAAARATGAATGNALQVQDSTAVVMGALAQKSDAAAPLPHAAPAGVTVRGAQAAPAAPAARAESQIFSDGSAARRAPPVMSTSWTLIARQPAREVLGVDPVIIPGFAVRAYRRNPAAQEIAVEQVTDAGTTIALIERRVDTSADARRADVTTNAPGAMAKSVNERLARFVGSLRVEIDGPLTPDSLSSLLELAR